MLHEFYCFRDDALLTPIVDEHGATDYWICGKCQCMYDISINDNVNQRMIVYAGEKESP